MSKRPCDSFPSSFNLSGLLCVAHRHRSKELMSAVRFTMRDGTYTDGWERLELVMDHLWDDSYVMIHPVIDVSRVVVNRSSA